MSAITEFLQNWAEVRASVRVLRVLLEATPDKLEPWVKSRLLAEVARIEQATK